MGTVGLRIWWGGGRACCFGGALEEESVVSVEDGLGRMLKSRAWVAGCLGCAMCFLEPLSAMECN